MNKPIRVVIVGAAGRMGLETVRAIDADSEFKLVGAVGRSNIGADVRSIAGIVEKPPLTLAPSLRSTLESTPADVVIDYAHGSAALPHARDCVEARTPFVFGMTGIPAEDLKEIEDLCRTSGVPGMVVPNFAIGAVLMIRFSEMAAKWLPDAEVIEMHHERKEDAPSGTAMLTAERIGRARGHEPTPLPKPLLKAEGARGATVNRVPVHSVRLPGLLAHQQVLFGGVGETLTIRHDSLHRQSFMPGVKLCAKSVAGLTGLTIGLDSLLF